MAQKKSIGQHAKSRAKPGWLVPGMLASAIVLLGYALLIIRLEVTQEGYRLSALSLEVEQLQRANQRLRLEAAELSSDQRLRLLAPRYGLRPPAPGEVVMMR